MKTGIGNRMEKYISGTAQRAQKHTHMNRVNWSFKKQQKQNYRPKNSLLNKWFWNNWTPTYKKMNLGKHFTLFIKINSEWILDLNVKWKTIELLEDNIRWNTDGLGFGDDIIDAAPTAWSRKQITDKPNFIKFKNPYSADTLSREWEDKPKTRIKCSQKSAIPSCNYDLI